MTYLDNFRSRFQPDHRVLAGDVLVLAAFVGVGLHSHGSNPVSNPIHWLQTAAPFVIGWLVMSALSGAHGTKARESYGYVVKTVVPGWVFGAVVGAGLRYSPRVLAGEPVSPVVAVQFAVVMTSMGLLFLVPWRLTVVYLTSRRS